MFISPTIPPPPPPVSRVNQVNPAFRVGGAGSDEAYEDERRLLRRWQDRIEFSREAYRRLDSELGMP